jgi:hypothetical protein
MTLGAHAPHPGGTTILGRPAPQRIMGPLPQLMEVTTHKFHRQTLIFIPKSVKGHMSMVGLLEGGVLSEKIT